MSKQQGLIKNYERQLLVRAGHTDADIANELGLSLLSVYTYWRVLTKKLGVRSRTAALIKALKLGEVTVKQLIV